MAAFIWLLYRMKHGDCMESVTVGNDGITIRQKSGQIMQYTRGQVLNIDMYRMTNRGATMFVFMLFGVAFVDLLFWVALYSKYKSYYPKVISKIELLEEGIGITQENKTYILANEIRCIKIHAPGFKPDRKSGIRKMTIKTVGNEVVCYLEKICMENLKATEA